MSDMKEKVYIEYLILKSQKDSSYLNELLDIIQPKIFSYCRRMIDNLDHAKEAAQDSLLEIFSKINQLKDYRKFHAWMYRVTHNKCIDHFRKSKPKLNQQFQNDFDIDQISIEFNEDNKLDILSIINNLPVKLKSVITLFYYEGFTVNEMAIILNSPAGTIKSDLFKAREIIKHFLEK